MCQWDGCRDYIKEKGKAMANEIIIRETGQPQIIKTQVTELSRGPQGPQGPAGADGADGRDGAIQYTAGTGISISSSNVISATGSSTTEWGDITGSLSNQTDLKNALDAKAGTTLTGALTDLTTTSKTNLVSAINEVDAAAGSAGTKADNLAAYFTLTNYGSISPTVTNGTINQQGTNMAFALNAAGTYGKIYGRVRYTLTSQDESVITLPINDLNASSSFTMSMVVWYMVSTGGAFAVANARDMVIDHVNKRATVTIPSQPNGSSITVWFPACVYYFTDFGDTPEP